MSISLVFLYFKSENTNINTDNITSQVVSQPERKTGYLWKGLFLKNEITLSQVDTSKDPTFNMSPERKKKYMQAMDEAARMAYEKEKLMKGQFHFTYNLADLYRRKGETMTTEILCRWIRRW